MGEARHDHGGSLERAGGERALQCFDLQEDRVDGVAHPEPEVDGDLVVARARGVQTSRRGADNFA